MTNNEEVFLSSLTERLRIWYNKEVLKLPREQWTKDKLFQQYKFCNVFRWQDRTSQYLYEAQNGLLLTNWQRAGLRWLASPYTIRSYARAVQTPEWVDRTYEGFAKQVVAAVQANPAHPLATGAFIVKRDGNDIAHLTRICEAADIVDKSIQGTKTSLAKTIKKWRELSKERSLWVADFTAGCIVYDYTYWQPDLFVDLFEWAPFGPGANNGLRHLYGSTSINGALHLQELVRANAQNIVQVMCSTAPETISSPQVQNIYARLANVLTFDIEHWLCEYYKYVRGYSKNAYVPFLENGI